MNTEAILKLTGDDLSKEQEILDQTQNEINTAQVKIDTARTTNEFYRASEEK